MGSSKPELIPIVEEVSSTGRIGSVDEVAETFGISKIGLSACSRHCPNKNPDRLVCNLLDSICIRNQILYRNRSLEVSLEWVHQNLI